LCASIEASVSRLDEGGASPAASERQIL